MNKKNMWPSMKPLTAIIHTITDLVHPEKIFLLSVISTVTEYKNIFQSEPVVPGAQYNFLFLVLAAESDNRSVNQLQDTIEQHQGYTATVTVMVLPVHTFNEWLLENQPFASITYRQAPLLYDAAATPLAIPDEQDESELQRKRSGLFAATMEVAHTLISDADLYTAQQLSAMATFHLHQAAKELYSGVVVFVTGLPLHTDDLDRLRRYAIHVLPAIANIFPCNSLLEATLFQRLLMASVYNHSNNDADIPYEVITQLSDRLKKLLALCKDIVPSKG